MGSRVCSGIRIPHPCPTTDSLCRCPLGLSSSTPHSSALQSSDVTEPSIWYLPRVRVSNLSEKAALGWRDTVFQLQNVARCHILFLISICGMNEFSLHLGAPHKVLGCRRGDGGPSCPYRACSLAGQAQTDKQLQFSVLVLAFTIGQLENQILQMLGF